MTSTWADTVAAASVTALEPLADPTRAPAMQAYMKDVAPFLGVGTPARRAALKAAWRDLPQPTSDELGDAAAALMTLRWRELHYAASDLVARFVRCADATFIERYLPTLITTTPWWDTVDSIGSAGVSPLFKRYGALDTIWRWNASGDRWLVRSSIQHQRGWRSDTDVGLVLSLCAPHAADREFFVAKAIGWALRDLARLDPTAVRAFLGEHPALSGVARREARRGLGD